MKITIPSQEISIPEYDDIEIKTTLNSIQNTLESLNTRLSRLETPVVVPPPPEPPAPVPPAPTPTRNVLKQPFASNSIWNMPIGSNAIYTPAGMTGTYSDVWASMPYPDEDVIILKPDAPLTDIRLGPWAGNRCEPSSGTVLARVPVPTSFIQGSTNHNLASAVLLTDNRTLVNTQPFTRCTTGGVATSVVRYADSDLYGDGIVGAHGGSQLSSIGGTLRLGELRPGMQGPAHALKLVVNMAEAHRPSSYNDAYRWPALAADAQWNRYGTSKIGPVGFKMGALLALHKDLNITALNLETEPARQIAWTLQNYGGYVVDDAYGGQFGICTETGPDGRFLNQFKSDYGYDFWARQNATGTQAAWTRDIQKLIKVLHIIDNNAAASIGGGGTPRQPLAPAL